MRVFIYVIPRQDDVVDFLSQAPAASREAMFGIKIERADGIQFGFMLGEATLKKLGLSVEDGDQPRRWFVIAEELVEGASPRVQ